MEKREIVQLDIFGGEITVEELRHRENPKNQKRISVKEIKRYINSQIKNKDCLCLEAYQDILSHINNFKNN